MNFHRCFPDTRRSPFRSTMASNMKVSPVYNHAIWKADTWLREGGVLDNTRYSAPALEKGLDIIELLASHPEGLSLADLGKTLGRTTAEIFRMVVTLETRGYLLAIGDRYVLSLLLFQLAHRHQPVRSLVTTALPLMTQLANDVRQSFHLCVYQDGRVLI